MSATTGRLLLRTTRSTLVAKLQGLIGHGQPLLQPRTVSSPIGTGANGAARAAASRVADPSCHDQALVAHRRAGSPLLGSGDDEAVTRDQQDTGPQ